MLRVRIRVRVSSVREAHLGLRTALKKEKKSELGLGSGPG